MKTKWLFIIWGLLFSVSLTAQNGKITLPETTLSNAMKTLAESGQTMMGTWFNPTVGGTDFSVSYFSFQLKNPSMDVLADNKFSMTTNFDAFMIYNAFGTAYKSEAWDFIITLKGTIESAGNFQSGLSAKFKTTSAVYNRKYQTYHLDKSDEMLDLLISMMVLSNKFPNQEFLFPIDQLLYKNANQQIFGNGSAVAVTTDDNNIYLTFPTLDMPPVIEAYNDIDNQYIFGKVQRKETVNGSDQWVNYRSELAIFDDWQPNTTKDVKSSQNTITYQGQIKKHDKWYKKDKQNINNVFEAQPWTAPRQISIDVSNVDQKYVSKFVDSRKLKLTAYGEGIPLSTGQFVYEAETINSPYDAYAVYDLGTARPIEATFNDATPWYFLNWSDGVTQKSRDLLVTQDVNLSAYWKGILTSNTSGWVQSGMENFNGTEAVLYPSMNELWLHIEEIS